MLNLAFDFDASPVSDNSPFISSFQPVKAVPRPETDSWCDYDKSAPKSPWGPVQHMTNYKNGCIEVSTSGHGGMKVEGSLAKKIPLHFRLKWYEEDSDVMIPLYFLYDDFKVIADTLSEDEARRFGFIGAVKRLTKEQCLERLLACGAYAATYDLINKTTRPVESFSSEYDRRDYVQRLESLKKPVPPKVLTHGQKVRFVRPLIFSVDRKDVEISDFTVVNEGRKVLFHPVGHTFLARIKRWAELDYSIVS